MKIDNTAILQAAINILNTKGLSALSMRALADQLNVKAASLYFHIKNKDELLEQISEGISERVYTHLESMKDPDLRQLMTVFRDELKNIQDSPQIFSNTAPFTPYRTKLIEISLTHITRLGIAPAYATAVGNLVNNYVLSFVADEQYFARVDQSSFEATPFQSPIDMAEPDHSFEFGLDLIFAGIAAKGTAE